MASLSAESIFDIFKKYKVPVNGVLYPRHISASTQLWDKIRQERLAQDTKTLASEGYIVLEQDGYRLTQKGYNYIYQHYSLQDTVDIILGDFRRNRIGEDEMLLQQNVLTTLKNADRYHFDNYDEAIKQLSAKGWISYNPRGIVLTHEGYHEVYPE